MAQNGSQGMIGSVANGPMTESELITALSRLLGVGEKEVRATHPPGPKRKGILVTKIRNLILEQAKTRASSEG